MEEELRKELADAKKKIAGLIVQLDSVSAELLKEKDFEKKTEKKIGFWVRAVVRLMAWAVLAFYTIFRIIMPVVAKEPLYLDTNDGYIMMGSIALLLAIEAVKAATERWLSKKT